MRILYLSEFYPPTLGGVEVHVANLAEEFVRRGHEVHVATLTPQKPDAALASFVSVHCIPSLAASIPRLHASADRPFATPLPDPRIRLHLTRLLERVKPDIIHAHNWLVSSLPPGSDVPVVMTSHDSAYICPKRTLLRPDMSVCDGPGWARCIACSSSQYGKVKAVAATIATLGARRTVRPTAHIAVSRTVGDAIGPYTGTPPIVIPNFVPPDITEETEEDLLPPLPPGPLAVFAGAALPHKGIGILKTIWQRNPPCTLVIAALDPPKETWGEDAHILSLHRKQMVSLWRRATIALVPSLCPDAAPTVVLEAMAHGVPVVGSALGGISELVEDGVTGILVPPGDEKELVRAVCRLLDDSELRQAMSVAARARAADYSLHNIADRLDRLYRDLLPNTSNL